MQTRIILTGYGIVAKELINLITTQNEVFKKKYQIEFIIVGIVGSKGMLYEANGINLQSLLTYGVGSKALTDYANDHQLLFSEPSFNADVLVECTPTNIKNGEPGLSYCLQAIDAGMDIVSVSKGALVHSYNELQKKAKENQIRIKYSGATAAALPTLDIGEYSLSGTTITKIEGILNGTSNFVLTSMEEDCITFDEALQIAKEKGIAESNPSLDIQGFDSACKILLLANGLLETNFTINDVAISGIEYVTKADFDEAKSKGNNIKLIAQAIVEEDKIYLEVKPRVLDSEHPLSHVKGTNKGILFETKEMGTICTTGGASHPRGAAAAALKDMINLYRKDMVTN